MIYLQANTPAQSLFLTLKEGALIFGDCTNYLMKIVNQSTLQELFVLPTIYSENDRVTHLQIGTNNNDPLYGSIEVLTTGRWAYTIYGQNSYTNLDPSNANVRGVYEIGYLYILKEGEFYQEQDLPIPTDIEYNG